MIHRADRLAVCLDAMNGRFGSLAILPIYPRSGSPASRILLSAVKGGAAALSIAPPLVLHGPGGAFTTEVGELQRCPE